MAVTETAKRLAAQQDNKSILNICFFNSVNIIGYLNFD